MGYYNGGTIARLDDADQPDISGVANQQIERAAAALRNLDIPHLNIEVRPQQITIESSIACDVKELWLEASKRLQESRIDGVKIVVSAHSVDVVPITTTKLAVLKTLTDLRPNSTLLAIGDQPRWPGNDSELLSHEFSLSVDDVDSKPRGVWNLAPAGVLGSAALRYYLRRVSIRPGYFRLRLASS